MGSAIANLLIKLKAGGPPDHFHIRKELKAPVHFRLKVEENRFTFGVKFPTLPLDTTIQVLSESFLFQSPL